MKPTTPIPARLRLAGSTSLWTGHAHRRLRIARQTLRLVNGRAPAPRPVDANGGAVTRNDVRAGSRYPPDPVPSNPEPSAAPSPSRCDGCATASPGPAATGVPRTDSADPLSLDVLGPQHVPEAITSQVVTLKRCPRVAVAPFDGGRRGSTALSTTTSTPCPSPRATPRSWSPTRAPGPPPPLLVLSRVRRRPPHRTASRRCPSFLTSPRPLGGNASAVWSSQTRCSRQATPTSRRSMRAAARAVRLPVRRVGGPGGGLEDDEGAQHRPADEALSQRRQPGSASAGCCTGRFGCAGPRRPSLTNRAEAVVDDITAGAAQTVTRRPVSNDSMQPRASCERPAARASVDRRLAAGPEGRQQCVDVPVEGALELPGFVVEVAGLPHLARLVARRSRSSAGARCPRSAGVRRGR